MGHKFFDSAGSEWIMRSSSGFSRGDYVLLRFLLIIKRRHHTIWTCKWDSVSFIR